MLEEDEIPQKFKCYYCRTIMLHPVMVIRRNKNIYCEGEGIICEHTLFHEKFSMKDADSKYLTDLKNEIGIFLEKNPRFQKYVFSIQQHTKSKQEVETIDVQAETELNFSANNRQRCFRLSDLWSCFNFLTGLASSSNSNKEVSEKTPLLSKTNR